MKLKEIECTAHVAWSPLEQHPIYLATGTAGEQFDASFSSNSSLDIYGLNLDAPGLEMTLKASLPTEHRFNKLIWSPNGATNQSSSGLLIGGADEGRILIYNPDKMIAGDHKSALVCSKEKHSGSVKTLDYNPFQANLIASGASESEIYIWDLNNAANPMTPGAKSQPFDPVICVSWNRQVQHILASTFASRCVVWDLRKNEPIIKVSDSTSKMRYKVIAWHPDVATQLCLASEDDSSPVVQLWDLRYAASPIKQLERHQKGILSLAWCQRDADLLMTCGKDNRILCWNPTSPVEGGEVRFELNMDNQWSFDVGFCPKNPNIISSSSFDGHVSLYSLMGGHQFVQPSAKITEAFPGAETFGCVPVSDQQQMVYTEPIRNPPKWFKRPCGASFGFGGKLITFGVERSADPNAIAHHSVYVSQLITEPDFVNRSRHLEQVLNTASADGFAQYCQMKVDAGGHDQTLWRFLKANFEGSPRLSFLGLLGYDSEDSVAKIRAKLEKIEGFQTNGRLDTGELIKKMSNLDTGMSPIVQRFSPSFNRSLNGSCHSPGSNMEASMAFDAIAYRQSDDVSPVATPVTICTDFDIDGLLTRALLIGNFELAVELCFHDNRTADAIILSIAGGPELLAKTQRRYLKSASTDTAKLISSVINNSWDHVVKSCELTYWKETLSGLLTYAGSQEFSYLCETLAARLEEETNGRQLSEAVLCYVCSGNFEKVADCLAKIKLNGLGSSVVLLELVEQTMILKKSIEMQRRQELPIENEVLACHLSHYASRLAMQGNLETALSYLGNSNTPKLKELRERIIHSLRNTRQSEVAGPTSVAPAQQPFTRQPARRVSESTSSAQGFGRGSSQQPNQTPFYDQSSSSNSFQPTPMTGFPPAPSVPAFNQPQSNVYAPPTLYGAGVVPPQRQTPLPVPPPSKADYYQPPVPTPPPNQSAAGSYQGGGVLSSRQRYPSLTQPERRSSFCQSDLSYQAPPMPVQQPALYQPAQQQQQFQTQNYNYGAPSQPIQPPPLPSQQGFNEQVKPFYPGQQMAEPTPPPSAGYQQQSFQLPPYNPSGWNDPPAFQKAAKKLPAQVPLPAQAPITQPIFGAAPDPLPPTNGYGYSSDSNFSQPPPPAFNNQQMFKPPPQQSFGYTPDAYSNQIQNAYQTQPDANVYSQQNANTAQTQIVQPEVVKGPVPSEHLVIQDTFEDLRNRCSAVATNPQVKRKLDDVTRKLEALFDKLRDCSLSPNTTAGLHRMVESVQNGDYQSALQTHTQLVSSGSFAESSSFMPGLKVLLQTATQLAVYLR